MDNTKADGSLNTIAFQRAMLKNRNTPDRDTKLSPAICIFGHSFRDFIPKLPGRYGPHNTWRETLSLREEASTGTHKTITSTGRRGPGADPEPNRSTSPEMGQNWSRCGDSTI